jgi:hypothetical protein
MGTNFYARIIPKEEDKQKLIDAINDDRDDLIEDLASELYGHRNEYTRKGNKIHLGKRSGGWKFIWNPNVIRYTKEYINDNNQYVPVFKYDYVYPLTKRGITDFCNREDVIITDECGEQYTSEEFLEMAFSWGEPGGLTAKEYQENPKYNAPPYFGCKRENEKWEDLGFKVEYYDFESDGLRFSTSINFS